MRALITRVIMRSRDAQCNTTSAHARTKRKRFPSILIPRGCTPFGQHQESRSLARSDTGSPRFTDFPSLCACSESSLTNLIGSSLILLCFQSQSEPDSHWTCPEVVILGAGQKEPGLLGREQVPSN